MFVHLQYIPGALKECNVAATCSFLQKKSHKLADSLATEWTDCRCRYLQSAQVASERNSLHFHSIFNWTALQDIYLPVELIGSPESLGNYMIYLD